MPKTKGTTAYSKDGYKIEKWEVGGDLTGPGADAFTPGEVLYNVYSPDNQVILGNVSTLEEAKGKLRDYVSTGGYKKWGDIKKLVKSKTNREGYDIDPKIRSLIKDLNEAGYTTTGSCAGHGYDTRGYVVFVKDKVSNETKPDIESIFNQHGIKVNWEHDKEYTKAVFPPVR